MKKLIPALILWLSFTSVTLAQDKPVLTTFILVRHAEKSFETSPDPGLSPEGTERAKRLSVMLKNTSIDVICSTNYKRTRSTVEPLATAKNLPVLLYEPKTESMLKLVQSYPGKTVLICGHSNTTPELANLLTGTKDFQPYRDDEYGIVLIVTVTETGKNAQVTRINY